MQLQIMSVHAIRWRTHMRVIIGAAKCLKVLECGM